MNYPTARRQCRWILQDISQYASDCYLAAQIAISYTPIPPTSKITVPTASKTTAHSSPLQLQLQPLPLEAAEAEGEAEDELAAAGPPVSVGPPL
jgi:hypothetical protein